MIKFVVVDDDLSFSNKVKGIIDSQMFNNDETYEVFLFSKCNKSLVNMLDDNSVYKIYILDIDLNDKVSGLDIAKKIREKDWDSEIIFTTNHDRMFESVFRNVYKVFDFIEKFHNLEERLSNDIKKILNNGFDNKKFFYCSSRAELQIFFKDIMYIFRDTVERKIVIVTTNNRFMVNLSIQETLEKLDERFKQVHRACIVNDDYVNLFEWNKGYFALKNGDIVNLCSKKYKRVNK